MGMLCSRSAFRDELDRRFVPLSVSFSWTAATTPSVTLLSRISRTAATEKAGSLGSKSTWGGGGEERRCEPSRIGREEVGREKRREKRGACASEKEEQG